MSFDLDALDIVQNKEKDRFEADVNGELAEVNYIITAENKIVFTHTEVPVSMEGMGVGGKLARHVLNFAEENEMVVVPLCPFIAAYIRRHPEYRPLVMKGYKL